MASNTPQSGTETESTNGNVINQQRGLEHESPFKVQNDRLIINDLVLVESLPFKRRILVGIFLFLTSYLLLIGVVGFSITYRFVAKFEESEHMLNTTCEDKDHWLSIFNALNDDSLSPDNAFKLLNSPDEISKWDFSGWSDCDPNTNLKYSVRMFPNDGLYVIRGITAYNIDSFYKNTSC